MRSGSASTTSAPTRPASRSIVSTLIPGSFLASGGSGSIPNSLAPSARDCGMADDDLVYLAITRLLGAYADIATRKAWSDFAPLAAPDARFTFDTKNGTFEVVGAEAFGELGAQSLEGFTFYEYIPLNVVVQVDTASTARGRVYSFE